MGGQQSNSENENQIHINFALNLIQTGLDLKDKAKYDKSLENLEKSLAIMEIVYQKKPNDNIAHVLNCIGAIYRVKGDYDKSL